MTNLSPQTANSTAEQPLSIDERRELLYEAQTELLKLVDELMNKNDASGPIEVINELLFHWLTTPSSGGTLPLNLDSINVQNQLFQAFNLVNFLAKAYELNIQVQDAKEVSREN